MLSFVNFCKKMMSLFFAVMLLCSGGINSIFNGDIYEFAYSTDVIGIETLTRSQGVTTDGRNWIFSGKTALESVSIETGEITALNTDAIPKELAENYGSAHIGGISFAAGKLYCALEDSKKWNYPLIAVYDAGTLKYTGEFHLMPTDNHKRGIPWVIADGDNGIIYAGDSRNYSEIYKYDINTFEYLGTLAFSSEIEAIQGGEYFEGSLYFGTNDKTRAVYRVDAETGETEKLFDRITYEYKYIDNFGGEGEDLTVLPLDDGTFIHTLQLGALFVDATLRHYK